MTNPDQSSFPVIAGRSAQKRPVYQGCLRVGPMTGLPQLLRELGVDPVEMMSSIGLDLALFADPENMISFLTIGQLLKLCAVRTQCPYFGLLLGQRGGLESLGLIGDLARNMADVGSALRSLILHLHIHDQGGVPTLSVNQGVAVVGYLIYQPGVEGCDQFYDAATAIIFNLLRDLCGPAWRPVEALFSRRRPDNIEPYRSFFQTRLRFDAEQTALAFPAKWLDCAVTGADPLLRQELQQRIAVLENLIDQDLIAQLRRVLRVALITHRSSLEQVAQLFSMHRRTMNRRLEKQHYTFQRLVNEVRYEISRQLLEDTHIPLSQIAAILDYNDASAFSRAFRRWSGTAPVAWRAQRVAEKVVR